MAKALGADARAATVSKVRAWLEEHGIAIAGRFAEWAYINSDEALARGMEIGDTLSGRPDTSGAIRPS